MKRFAVIGVGGYIAPRHLRAIKETGNEVVCALDPSDSVGVIDSYFPDADFFTEFERFDRHLDKLRREQGHRVDYVSICSPNYLHDSHIRFALRIGADAICEKPLVLNPWNADALEEIARETGQNVNVILQLRLHPAIIELKKYVDSQSADKIHDIDLAYITPRGHWYRVSWKGDVHKSGGVATNIGVHFFDMLAWIFGGVKKSTVNVSEPTKVGGILELQRARVRYFLSLDRNDLPEQYRQDAPKPYRSIKVDDREIEFSGGFTDLHTHSYREILAGNGFRMADARTAIQIVSDIRDAKPVGLSDDCHPLLRNYEPTETKNGR